MKIKDVCNETKLTDKSVRFYIESGLINPEYSENYAGRRNYSFSENDVEALKKIALLRQYNFSINEIKQILSDSENINSVLANHILEIRNSAVQTNYILDSLVVASNDDLKSLDDLCRSLSKNENLVHSADKTESDDFNLKLTGVWKSVKSKLPFYIILALLAVFAGIGLLALIIFVLTEFFVKYLGV